ncbi:hypothetical protein [Prauserella rugosa]|uniref:hypothetical protein n=1 Tax=Prauserella rugosa TaxID=43354 RepID=UPI001B864D56|nr:hypothetical protein [Prauserella rugosa]
MYTSRTGYVCTAATRSATPANSAASSATTAHSRTATSTHPAYDASAGHSHSTPGEAIASCSYRGSGSTRTRNTPGTRLHAPATSTIAPWTSAGSTAGRATTHTANVGTRGAPCTTGSPSRSTSVRPAPPATSNAPIRPTKFRASSGIARRGSGCSPNARRSSSEVGPAQVDTAQVENSAALALTSFCWWRADLPREVCEAYWRDVHGPMFARVAGLWQYRQLRLAANRADLWPSVPGLSFDVPVAAQPQGIPHGLFVRRVHLCRVHVRPSRIAHGRECDTAAEACGTAAVHRVDVPGTHRDCL